MKPAVAISAVVIGVLVTVVIEETRIKKLRDEITRLRALPEPEALPAPAPAPAPEPVAAAGEGEQPAPTPPPPTPAPGLRNVPENYPAPDEERIQKVALSPYSQLHYALNLTNRERAYFEDLLGARRLEQQELAGQWIDALPDDRIGIEQSMDEIDKLTEGRVRDFLENDGDFQAYLTYHAMQPERELLSQLAPVMDQKGVVLELDKELKLIEAMHQSRTSAEGIDWNSLEGIKAVAEGGAMERFTEEWDKQGELLSAAIGEFLEEAEVEALLAAREQVKGIRIESLESAIEAIR